MIDWNIKAKKAYDKHGWHLNGILRLLARGLRYEHMFKKLWEILRNDGCPPDKLATCEGDECPYEKCWRHFRKELEKK